MLKIDRAVLDKVSQASSPGDLLDLVHEAIRLEFSTIPPYLTAMMSLRPGTNRTIWTAIHDVVVDEMLHMLIGCNLLNALGGAPVLDGDLVPDYPSTLPLNIGSGLVVGLEPFSLDLVERVFMQIEEPEEPLIFTERAGRDFAVSAAPEFATIGEFYRALAAAVEALGHLPGNESRQIGHSRWFPPERLFPIRDVSSAVAALTLVTEEGEGTATSPIDPDGDVAHYYRFQAIRRGRSLVEAPELPEGYAFRGQPYHFDAGDVWPLTPNQRPEDLEPHTEAWREVHTFRLIFTRLLRALHRTVNGEPEMLDAAMGTMFELKLAGQRMAATPIRRNGVDVALHAGPVFIPLGPTG